MLRVLFSLLCLTLLSCRQPNADVRTYNLDGYILSDTVLHGREAFIPFTANANYFICYIGPAAGHIGLGRPLRRYAIRDTMPEPVLFAFDGNKLTLQVDTAYTQIQIDHYHYDSINARPIMDAITMHPAMRLTLKNTSDTILYLGKHNFLKYTWLEIQNGKQEWIRVEKPSDWNSYCSSGAPSNFLRPGDILIAKFPRYEGEYTANCRLVWQKPDQPKYARMNLLRR